MKKTINILKVMLYSLVYILNLILIYILIGITYLCVSVSEILDWVELHTKKEFMKIVQWIKK